MKFLLVCLAFVLVAVFAEDLFYYSSADREILHRFNHICYVMHLTEDQHNSLDEVAGIIAIQTLMRELQENPAHTTILPESQHNAFITGHCHNRLVMLVTQPALP